MENNEKKDNSPLNSRIKYSQSAMTANSETGKNMKFSSDKQGELL